MGLDEIYTVIAEVPLMMIGVFKLL
jgi:hypothetical protein